MNNRLRKDIIEWDVRNWGTVIDFIKENHMDFKGKSVLELGARNGELSLYYALKGAKVVCSDLEGPTKDAHDLHKRYGVSNSVEYEAIDATDIPDKYKGKFDYITFKSVIGGIGSWNDLKAQKKCVACCYKCLKPGGRLIFADNMKASVVHRIARRLFVKWGGKWHYETKKEIHMLMRKFKLIDERYVGVAGCFGRSEESRNRLGKLDSCFLNKIVPDSWKYIGMYIYEKNKVTD